MTNDTEQHDNEFAKFKEEVLDQGPESCLPKNLAHFWLGKLSTQANILLKDGTPPGNTRYTELLAALIQILFHKNTNRSEHAIEVALTELFEHCQNYAIELSLEEVYRKTEMKYNAATLDTILTNRDVNIWQDE